MIDPPDKTERSRVQKRSVLVTGHRTSVSLEKAFWDELQLIAQRENLSINELVSRIDAQRAGNLSSALRLYILEVVKQGRGPEAAK